MNWYLAVLKKYAVFSGRARRKEYWMFALFNTIFAIVAVILDYALGITIKGIGYGPIYIIFSLAMLLPSLGVTVRRLHDIGKSGWFIFINLIICIGWIWFIVLACTEGQPGENQYGPNPKEAI
jgi:uncharacterized membrane protein YhaH (DUF805 family)